MPWNVVQRLLDEHRIDSSSGVEASELPTYVERLRLRGGMRLQAAANRASSLQPHLGILDIFRCESDLLEYLANAVQYYATAHGRTRAGKLAPLLLTHPTRWHCTRQGDWKREIPIYLALMYRSCLTHSRISTSSLPVCSSSGSADNPQVVQCVEPGEFDR